MLHVSYEMLGITIVALLIGLWVIRRFIGRKKVEHGCGSNSEEVNFSRRGHDIEHRALMFLMTRKTDSMLAALARTIEQERQKLGPVVRNPSMTEAIDAFQAEELPVSDNRQSPYDRILPMVHDGIAVANIARQLQLPEAEVSLVMRLKAA